MDLNERFEEVSAKMDELKAKAEKASREVKESWNEGIANFKSDMAFTMESINEVADEAEKKHDQKVEERIDKIETKRDERLEKRREKVYALRDRIMPGNCSVYGRGGSCCIQGCSSGDSKI